MTDDEKYRATSFNQQGGITAGQVKIGSIPRRLDMGGQSQLRSLLPKDKPVTVTSVMGDGEAFQYANEIKSFLVADGYTVDGVNQALYSEPKIGQGIVPGDDSFEVIIGTRA